jgi:hypothetical protein
METNRLQFSYGSECFFYNFTKENELLFSIEFWKDDLHQRILKHVNEQKASGTPKCESFREVILTTTKPSRFYQLTNSWVPYRGQKLMNDTLTVHSEFKCKELRDHMLSKPR